MDVGRNDPCWCGSGVKYKKCHLDADAARERGDQAGDGASRAATASAASAPADGAGLGPDDPCWCLSGTRYSDCHRDTDIEMRPAVLAALLTVRANLRKHAEYERRLRDEFGIYINYVSPIDFRGGKVAALGDRLYLNRRANETYHEFLISVLASTLSEEWRAREAQRPQPEQHFALRCFDQFTVFKAAHADSEKLARHGHMSAEMNGWVRYLASMAWDVATLIHATDLPDVLLARLRDRDQFQGARYEIAIAAIFARLDCSIHFLDEDESVRGVKHVEFEAVHRPSGKTFAVEAKSRHRSGVLNRCGERDAARPLRRDISGVGRLFRQAVAKAPEDLPYFIFIDINAPLDEEVDNRWRADVGRWMSSLPTPTPDAPDVFNELYITNFSPHYDGDDISRGMSWQGVLPLHVRVPLDHDIRPVLQRALDTFGRVPALTPDGMLTG